MGLRCRILLWIGFVTGLGCRSAWEQSEPAVGLIIVQFGTDRFLQAIVPLQLLHFGRRSSFDRACFDWCMMSHSLAVACTRHQSVQMEPVKFFKASCPLCWGHVTVAHEKIETQNGQEDHWWGGMIKQKQTNRQRLRHLQF